MYRRISFAVVLIVYLAASVAISTIARSDGFVNLGNARIPLYALTGILSSLSNILIIFMVLFFRKTGFMTALVLLLMQVPVIVRGMIMAGTLGSLPGLFNNALTIIAIIIIYRRMRKIDDYQNVEFEHLREQQKFSQRLFEQTATALVNAIDAKDVYSHGHSIRVAEYSEKIARMSGKDDDECYRIYYAALLHDVGKIGIPNHIINKKGKLTEEEYEIIKEHPVKGNQILSSINEYPYLSIGAHYHHERYDGKGYPDRLKGEDIPEIARIISVADAYDAMSSNRSYRNAIPQQLVREEIIKGSGTQFDPVFAGIMNILIDQDTEYRMRERQSVSELAGRNELVCSDFGSDFSDGIAITRQITKIHMCSEPAGDAAGSKSGPALVLFDSLDGRVHDEEKTVIDLNYFEYCRIWVDGRSECSGARKIQTDVISRDEGLAKPGTQTYDIEAVKYRDHVLIRLDDGQKDTEITIALPDSSRFVYIALTGENCRISDVSISKEDEEIPEGFITRIAEEISYIDVPEGDMPNIQIDGYRTGATAGIPIVHDVTLSFHSMSLPTARLIWHCPYLVVFSSADGTVDGADYKEYALVRLDGENWESEGIANNDLVVERSDEFKGWDAWKEQNKKGIDVEAVIVRDRKTITVTTENLGISIKNTVTQLDDEKEIFVCITGDQCAITGIKIR